MAGFGSDLNNNSDDLDLGGLTLHEIEQRLSQVDDAEIERLLQERRNQESVPLAEIAKLFGIELDEVDTTRRVAGFALPEPTGEIIEA